jgi:2-methylcitrate dehydratase PrpD
MLGHAGHRAFTDEVLHDPAVAALRQRVRIREDPQLTARVPRLKPARVTLILKDGRESTHTCESARGDFQRPYQVSELRTKFRVLAGLVLSQEGVAAVEAALDRCEHGSSVRELTDLMRRHGLAPSG